MLELYHNHTSVCAAKTRVAGWYERMRERPAYQTAITDWFEYDPSWRALMIEKGAEIQDRMLAMVEA